MVITGGIVASLIVGSAYFLLDPTLALKRLFVIPLLMLAADLTMRFFTSTSLPARIGKIAMLLGIPAVIATSTSVAQRLPISQLIGFGRRLNDEIFSR
jgi:hypothetical protein